MMDGEEEIQAPDPVSIDLADQDISFDADAPVKGKARMDSAWGSSQGDEVNTDIRKYF